MLDLFVAKEPDENLITIKAAIPDDTNKSLPVQNVTFTCTRKPSQAFSQFPKKMPKLK
jgi:hypothetical protein